MHTLGYFWTACKGMADGHVGEILDTMAGGLQVTADPKSFTCDACILLRYDTVPRRFSLCLGYVAILRHLHAHQRVMCDSNTLAKTLSQYLVRGDLSLRVNDLDALPRVTPGKRVTCGTPPLHGELLAPEQRGNASETASCDLKCDIWKVPDVCLWLLGNTRSVEGLKFRLFPVHRACKERDPERRPDAELLWQEYLNVWARWEADL